MYLYNASFDNIEITAVIRAAFPGIIAVRYSPEIIESKELFAIPKPVMNSITDKTMPAAHSNRSCPYGCSLSGALLDMRKPIMTMIVLNKSEAECTASEIIAAEWAKIPAKSFMTDSRIFTTMLTADTRVTILLLSIKSPLRNCEEIKKHLRNVICPTGEKTR